MGVIETHPGQLDRTAVLGVACREPLPAVASTLTGLIRATEVAAQRVLDEAERCAAARDRLCAALVRIKPFIAETEPAAHEACREVIGAVRAVSSSIEPIVTAMESQDLTEQHLRAGMAAVAEVRERLAEVLRLMNVSVTYNTAGPLHAASRVGTAGSPWRQAPADRYEVTRPPA